MQPTAHIVTIGDELLIGQVVDTNSAFIGAQAANAGIRVREISSISDNYESIKRAIIAALERDDIVIVTGGLGPTKDDISKRAIADIFSLDLVRDDATFEHVKEMMARHNIEFNALNAAQADIPRGFTALHNDVGTAPGLLHKIGSKLLFCLPGVPFEMKKLFTEQVLPIIAASYDLQPIIKRTVVVYGLSESELSVIMHDWEESLPTYLSLAYLPNANGIRLRLSSKSESGADEIDAQFATLKTLIPDYYIGDEGSTIEGELAKLLVSRGATLSIAESCTGGAISARCTAINGASRWYNGSVTSYSNDTKISVLGVNAQTIENHGAVSDNTVREMAGGVLKALHSTYSIATSGIAGPTGATQDKELGDIHIAIASDKQTLSYKRNFGQPREVFTTRASTAALNYLRLAIIKGLL